MIHTLSENDQAEGDKMVVFAGKRESHNVTCLRLTKGRPPLSARGCSPWVWRAQVLLRCYHDLDVCLTTKGHRYHWKCADWS